MKNFETCDLRSSKNIEIDKRGRVAFYFHGDCYQRVGPSGIVFWTARVFIPFDDRSIFCELPVKFKPEGRKVPDK